MVTKIVRAVIDMPCNDREQVDMHRRLIPFWCLDVTDLEQCVPLSESALTTHPCGAPGVAHIDLQAPSYSYAAVLNKVLDFLG